MASPAPAPCQAGLPSPNPTKSYWLQDPSTALLGHRTTENLPADVDVVIIGSGITGAFAAHFLKKGFNSDGFSAQEGESVVVLEAREACFGATGRNGGHCQPVVYGIAPEVAAFELANYHFLGELVKKEEIACDWEDVTGVHSYLTSDLFAAAAETAEQLKALHPEIAEGIEIVPASNSPRLAELHVPTVCGAIVQQRAASLWPYKLVAFILEDLLSTFPASEFNLQTTTPVTSIFQDGSSSKWEVITPRGKIFAKQLLLATNGYTSHLLPSMSDLIVPVRGQISALAPSLPQPKMNHSYLFASQKTDTTEWREDYLIQRPLASSSDSPVYNNTKKGVFIFGGGRGHARHKGIGQYRDDVVEEEVSTHLRTNLSPPLSLSSSQKEGEYTPSYEWTGIMGYSRDGNPWVGHVPESLGGGKGLFVCAGYTGHGMPNATLSAHAVVGMMRDAEATGEEGVGYMFPGEYLVSEERVGRARGGNTLVEAQEKDVWLEVFPGLGERKGGLGG